VNPPFDSLLSTLQIQKTKEKEKEKKLFYSGLPLNSYILMRVRRTTISCPWALVFLVDRPTASLKLSKGLVC
jgi:hypothetical protein